MTPPGAGLSKRGIQLVQLSGIGEAKPKVRFTLVYLCLGASRATVLTLVIKEMRERRAKNGRACRKPKPEKPVQSNNTLRNRPQRSDQSDHRSTSLRPHRSPIQGHDAQSRRGRRIVQIRLRVDEAPARTQAEATLTFFEREHQPPMCPEDPVSFAE